MRAVPLLRNTSTMKGILITGNLILPIHFLTTVSLGALLLLLGVGRGTFAILCFRRAKKRRRRFRKRRLGVHVFTV